MYFGFLFVWLASLKVGFLQDIFSYFIQAEEKVLLFNATFPLLFPFMLLDFTGNFVCVELVIAGSTIRYCAISD